MVWAYIEEMVWAYVVEMIFFLLYLILLFGLLYDSLHWSLVILPPTLFMSGSLYWGCLELLRHPDVKDRKILRGAAPITVSQELHQPKTFGTRDLTSRILLTYIIT